MNRLRRHALTSWIACLAILFGALAPTLSHALNRSAAQPINFPICSAAGHAVPDSTPAGSIDLGADPFKHCPFCADQHHAPGLLPQAPATLAAVSGTSFPSLFYTAPAPLFHWAAPQSRAPPVAS
jgi:hypothetical protein